jgi:hypothetical protein
MTEQPKKRGLCQIHLATAIVMFVAGGLWSECVIRRRSAKAKQEDGGTT